MKVFCKRILNSNWVMVGSMIAIIVSSLFLINLLHESSGRSRKIENLLSHLELQVHKLDALKWQAAATLTFGPDIKESAGNIERDINETIQMLIIKDSDENGLKNVLEAYRVYDRALHEEFDLYAARQFVRARQVNKQLVDPGFSELLRRIAKVSTSYHSTAVLMMRLSDYGIVVTWGITLLLIVFLSLNYYRQRQINNLVELEKAILHNNEDKYRKLVEFLPDAVFVRHKGRFVFVNSSGLRLFGACSLEEIEEHQMLSLVCEDLSQEAEAKGAAPEISGIRKKLQRMDGTDITVELSTVPFTYMGEPAIQCILHDITGRQAAEESLRQMNEKLNAVIQASPLAIVVTDPSYIVSTWNPAAERIFGWKQEEVLNNVYPIVPKERVRESGEMLSWALAGETLIGLETQRQDKNGCLIDINLFAAPVHDPEGNVTGIVVLLQDISERKRADEMHRRYHHLVEAAKDIVLVVRSSDERIIEVNQKAVDSYGYTKEELLSMSISDIREPLDFLYCQMDVAYSTGITFENNHRRKNGETFPVEVSCKGLDYDGEKIVISIVRDISERKKAEEALHEANEKLNNILEFSPLAIVILDTDNKVVGWNNAAEGTFGWSRQEVMGRFPPYVSGEMMREFNENILRELSADSPVRVEAYRKRKDGVDICVNIFVSRLCDKNGDITGLIGIIEDITDKKEAEVKLSEARKQSQEAWRIASMGAMVAGIAHQINQPLNSLKMLADSLLYWYDKGIEPEKNKVIQHLQKISLQTERAADIIKNLREVISKPESPDSSPCNINDVLNRSLDLMGPSLREIKVVKNLSVPAPMITGNIKGLEEIINNLILNAVDAFHFTASKDKTIVCKTGIDDGVVLEISDNATGLDDDILEKLFEPFFSTKNGRGMGIGLFVVHSLVVRFGGEISVFNNDMGGATFRIRFPSFE